VISLGQGKIQTLETEIAQTVLYQLNFEKGILLASLQTILTLVFIAGTRAFTKTGLSNLFSQSSYRFTSHPIGVIFGFSYLLIFFVFVFSILVRADFPNGFTLLETRGARDALNVSVIEAALNSFENLLIALVLSFPIAWFIATRKTVFLSRLVVLPIGISPVVIGLFFLLVAGYWLRANLDTFFLIPMAQSLILIPLIFQIIKPALEALDVEILDAAKLDGASSLKTSWFITAPLIRKPLVVALAFASLASLGEFGASSFLALGSDATLSLVMFQLASRPGFSNMSIAMTIALLYLMLSAVVVYLVSRERTTD
jgi:thiamine transport system permease protein